MNKEWSLQSAFREMNRFEDSMDKLLTLTGPTPEEFRDLRESILAMTGDKTVNEHILTVCYEQWEGDTTEHFTPKTSIADVMQANFANNTWTITATIGGTLFAGMAESKQEAILNYLKARLGIPKRRMSSEMMRILSVAQSALSAGGTWSDADRMHMFTETLTDIVKLCKEESDGDH